MYVKVFLKCNPRAGELQTRSWIANEALDHSLNTVTPCFHLILGHPTAAHFPGRRTSHLRWNGILGLLQRLCQRNWIVGTKQGSHLHSANSSPKWLMSLLLLVAPSFPIISIDDWCASLFSGTPWMPCWQTRLKNRLCAWTSSALACMSFSNSDSAAPGAQGECSPENDGSRLSV